MNFKKLLPFLLIGFSIVVISASFVVEDIATKHSDAPKILRLDGITFEIADTVEKQTLGLSGRTSIPHNYGMLFVFPEKGNYGFWMKDMKEPIDILWLDDDGTIIKINSSVSPDTYPTQFHPPVPIQYVLEMRAREAALKGFTVNSKIELPI